MVKTIVMPSIVQGLTFCFLHQPIKHILSSCPLLFRSSAQRFLKNRSFFSYFMSIDLGHIIAYLSRGIFLSTSTLYQGRKPRNAFSTLVLVDISGRSPSVWSGVLIIGSQLHDSTSFLRQKHFSHSLDCTVHLGYHHHYWCPSSHLLTVSIIDW